MSKKKTCIVFKNIQQLWHFAQTIHANSIEIITAENILICDCSENDLAIVAKYGGEIKHMQTAGSQTADRRY